MLKFFYIVLLFVYNVFRWPPPFRMQRCTRVENLRITSQYVFSEMLAVSCCIVCLSAFKSYRATTVHLTFQMTLHKKSGAVRSSEGGSHETSPKREITRCRNKRRSAAMLITSMWAIAPVC
jgi:hypothetical protein